MKEPKKILILYTELAGYLLACLRHLGPIGHQVTVIHWPVNPEAPFKLYSIENVDFKSREEFDKAAITSLIDTTGFDLILCSGWIDKDYIKALWASKKNCPRVVLMDNQWRGDLKQRLSSSLLGIGLRKTFDYAWVAGKRQSDFAQKIGFRENQIKTGFYSADTDLFNEMYTDRKSDLATSFPHTFLYVGRYMKRKGIFELWKAFQEIKEERNTDWKLICVGTGEEFENRVIHPDIVHLGFLQPEEMQSEVNKCGVFVLPSYEEPWGVVVHEFAAAGFPIVISEKVGAGDRFVEEGENGFSFSVDKTDDLKNVLLKIMDKSDQELLEMTQKSHELGQSFSPAQWSQTIVDLL